MIIKSPTFLEDIETLCRTKNLKYIDAIVYWCEMNNYEIEYAAELIKKYPVIKFQIQVEHFAKIPKRDSLFTV